MEVLLGAVNYKGTSNRECREYVDDGSNALHCMITIGVLDIAYISFKGIWLISHQTS